MAAALRNRCGHRRRFFHPHRPIDGSVFHGVRGRRPLLPLELAECAAGGGLRRLAHYFWSRHREEIWWLNKVRIVGIVPNPTSVKNVRPRQHGRRKTRRQIWIV